VVEHYHLSRVEAVEGDIATHGAGIRRAALGLAM